MYVPPEFGRAPAKDATGSNLECSLPEGLGYRMVGLGSSLAYVKCYFTLLYFLPSFYNTFSTDFFVFQLVLL